MFFAGAKNDAAKTFKPARGPGIGANEPFTGPLARRRRYAAQVLGDTPPRDGPFAQAAAPVAVAFPPKTRKEQKRAKNDPGGVNPFR